MDNGPNEIQRLTRRQYEERAIRKKNREREEKEAKTPIVTRKGSSKKKKLKYKPKAKKPVINCFEYPDYKPGMKGEFYRTREWRSIRYDVLRESNGKCCLCGRSPENGVILHVDHIKPRSRFPALELDKTNLQVLCEDCNIGKGAKT